MPVTRSKTESKNKKNSSKQLTVKETTRNKSPASIAQEFTIESSMASKEDSKAEVNDMVTRVEAKMDTSLNRISQINTYSMKQPDLYCFETIKMTSQA